VEPPYSDRIVAFIDILGFAALVNKLGSDVNLRRQLHAALSRIGEIKQSSQRENTAQTNLQVSVFSDSIVISSEPDYLHGVLWSAIHLQCALLGLGVLVRGGISSGPTFHEGDILYGAGMLDAYYLESKAAIYPRIIIESKLVNGLQPGYRTVFLDRDVDGLWFLNPFTMGILPSDSEALLEDGFDPYEESLKRLGRKIDDELARLSDVSQIAKWSWLKSHYISALSEFARFGKPRFWHVWAESEKEKKGEQ
jgi:hypothetical protein